jgi:DNA invertase Pin-like site-specific DNA recombinase
LTTIGYARESAGQEPLNLQIKALKNVPCDQIFKEAGAKGAHPELDAAIDILKAGDTLVTYKLAVLSKSIKDLNEIFTALKNKGVTFRSLDKAEEIQIIPGTDENVFRVIAAMVGIEKERAATGHAAAKQMNRQGGRTKEFEALVVKKKAQQLTKQGKSKAEIAKSLGMSRSTLYRLLDI